MAKDIETLKREELERQLELQKALNAEIRRIIDYVRTANPERGRTLRAPETATQDATLAIIMDCVSEWVESDDEDFSDLKRALRERLFR